MIENQKRAAMEASSEEDTIMAFVAVGGYVDADGKPAGEVSAEKIRKVVEQFKLTIDIEKLLAEADTDGSGFVDYDEFKEMLS